MATAYANLSGRQWLSNRIQRARNGVFSEVVELSPSIATELLENNPTNRPVTRSRIETYAKDIVEGRWQLNGEPIIISREGLLNDGQHRCNAVIKAERSIPTLVVFGVDRESRKTTDIGAAKTAGSFAGMDGIPNANTVAGIARLVLCYRETGGVQNTRLVTNTQVSEFIADNTESIVEMGRTANHYQRDLVRLVSPTVFGFCYYICAEKSREAADEFYHAVATGEMLASNDPAFIVRSRFASLGKAARQAKAELMFHGWNAFRRGEKRTLLRVLGQFPELV